MSSLVDEAIEDLIVEVDDARCSDCYSSRVGSCPCDGDPTCPSCYCYADHVNFVNTAAKCAEMLNCCL